LPEQRVIDGNVGNLAKLAHEANINGPSIVVIGEVVALRQGRSSKPD
jgi:siroheme synthase